MATLKHLFDRAQAIQDWLTTTARDIGRSVSMEFAKEYGYKGDLTSSPGDRVYYATPKAVSSENKGTGEARPRIPTCSTNQMDSAPKYRYPQTSITWTTPLGFQICQPYLEPETSSHKDMPAKLCLHTRHTHPYTPVNENRADLGIPSQLHSLPGCHAHVHDCHCLPQPSPQGHSWMKSGNARPCDSTHHDS